MGSGNSFQFDTTISRMNYLSINLYYSTLTEVDWSEGADSNKVSVDSLAFEEYLSNLNFLEYVNPWVFFGGFEFLSSRILFVSLGWLLFISENFEWPLLLLLSLIVLKRW